MALNDNAVVTAAQGFVFTNTVGALAPTPAELDALDPETFGSQVQTLTMTGSPTGGSFTVKVASTDTPATVAYNASPAAVQAALEGQASVGAGNVVVAGTNLASGYTVTFVGALQGAAPATLTIVNSGLTGGSTPAAASSVTTAANGWVTIGHTSRDDMPEFGFDGGDTEVKGTWQKKRLREVATGDPVADSVTVNLQQWDVNSLELYFGENSSATAGVFGVSGDFVPLEKAFLVVIVDGDVRIGFYAPKASLRRDDSIDLPVDEFSSLPIKATFLNLGASDLYQWISLDLFS